MSVQFYPSTQAKHQAVHETQVLRRYHQEDYHATQISPTNVPKDQRIKTSQFGVSAENWSKRKKIQRKHPKFGGWCPMVFRVLAATLPYIYIYINPVTGATSPIKFAQKPADIFPPAKIPCFSCACCFAGGAHQEQKQQSMSARGVHQRKHR